MFQAVTVTKHWIATFRLTDGGSEFLGEFEKVCKELKIPHYFTDPDHLNQNAYVESSHATDKREFYQIIEIPL